MSWKIMLPELRFKSGNRKVDVLSTTSHDPAMDIVAYVNAWSPHNPTVCAHEEHDTMMGNE